MGSEGTARTLPSAVESRVTGRGGERGKGGMDELGHGMLGLSEDRDMVTRAKGMEDIGGE